MDYYFDNYPSYEYSFFKFTKWITSVYLKGNTRLEEVYTEEDIDNWIQAIEKIITPDFIKKNHYDILLEEDMVEQGLLGVFWGISEAIIRGDIVLDDLVLDPNKVLAVFLRREVLWAMEEIISSIDTDSESDSFTGAELHCSLHKLRF